jgi:hypothetical protein
MRKKTTTLCAPVPGACPERIRKVVEVFGFKRPDQMHKTSR